MRTSLIDDRSILVQVMAWCYQATSHYLNQCWPRSMLLIGNTRSQCFKCLGCVNWMTSKWNSYSCQNTYSSVPHQQCRCQTFHMVGVNLCGTTRCEAWDAPRNLVICVTMVTGTIWVSSFQEPAILQQMNSKSNLLWREKWDLVLMQFWPFSWFN